MPSKLLTYFSGVSFWSILFATTTLAGFSCATASANEATQVNDDDSDGESPPNFIIIFTDDQGYNDLGCFGSPTIATPNIDRMAEEGIRLTDFYAQPVCGVSRAALMTGCYPIRVGEPRNMKTQHTILHPEEITMAELLQGAGYETAILGKWHLAGNANFPVELMPNAQGFDYYYGTPLHNGVVVNVTDTDKRSPLYRNTEVILDRIDSWDHMTQQYTEEAINFIEQNQEQPFFLFVSHNMAHIPLGASEEFRGRNPAGLYADVIEEIDWSTGRILETLTELGLDENTFVIFTSDNGPWIETTKGMRANGRPFIPRDHSGTAAPLRGYKMLTWEGGLRVPCVIRWPGHIPAGRESSEIASTMDLFPTFAHLAGAELPADRVIDGQNLWPFLSGETNESPRDTLYYYCYTHLQAVRHGPWKLVVPRPEYPRWTGWSGRFEGNNVDQIELYNLVEDIAEENDVAGQHPDIVEQLMALIEAGRQELGDYNQLGEGARFFDEQERRPGMRRWINQEEQEDAAE